MKKSTTLKKQQILARQKAMARIRMANTCLGLVSIMGACRIRMVAAQPPVARFASGGMILAGKGQDPSTGSILQQHWPQDPDGQLVDPSARVDGIRARIQAEMDKYLHLQDPAAGGRIRKQLQILDGILNAAQALNKAAVKAAEASKFFGQEMARKKARRIKGHHRVARKSGQNKNNYYFLLSHCHKIKKRGAKPLTIRSYIL
jgi:hypothetical protein